MIRWLNGKFRGWQGRLRDWLFEWHESQKTKDNKFFYRRCSSKHSRVTMLVNVERDVVRMEQNMAHSREFGIGSYLKSGTGRRKRLKRELIGIEKKQRKR